MLRRDAVTRQLPLGRYAWARTSGCPLVGGQRLMQEIVTPNFQLA